MAVSLSSFHQADDLPKRKADALTVYSRVMNTRSIFLASPHFANNVVLDWFGRTIIGKDHVLKFLFDEVGLADHNVIMVKNAKGTSIRPALQRVMSRLQQFTPLEESEMDDDSGFASGIYELSSDSSFSSSESNDTPCSKVASRLSGLFVSKLPKERDCVTSFDSNHPVLSTPFNAIIPSMKPLRRRPLISEGLKSFDLRNLEFMDASGIISFSSDEESLNPHKTWSQRCHLQLGYSNEPSRDECFCFSFILYNNDMPCRRNLSQLFDECA